MAEEERRGILACSERPNRNATGGEANGLNSHALTRYQDQFKRGAWKKGREELTAGAQCRDAAERPRSEPASSTENSRQTKAETEKPNWTRTATNGETADTTKQAHAMPNAARKQPMGGQAIKLKPTHIGAVRDHGDQQAQALLDQHRDLTQNRNKDGATTHESRYCPSIVRSQPQAGKVNNQQGIGQDPAIARSIRPERTRSTRKYGR